MVWLEWPNVNNYNKTPLFPRFWTTDWKYTVYQMCEIMFTFVTLKMPAGNFFLAFFLHFFFSRDIMIVQNKEVAVTIFPYTVKLLH